MHFSRENLIAEGKSRISGSKAVRDRRNARMRGYLKGSTKLAWVMTGKGQKESPKGSRTVLLTAMCEIFE